jgi:hypothetical protein
MTSFIYRHPAACGIAVGLVVALASAAASVALLALLANV